MPTYDYQCKDCGKVSRSVFREYDKRDDGPECCGAFSQRVWLQMPGFMGAGQFEAYLSPVDGRPITSEKARLEDLRRNNCVPYEEGIRQDQERNARRAEQDTDRLVEKIVAETAERANIANALERAE